MWKTQGLLVFTEGKLDFEASNERLLTHRNTVTHEPKKKDVTQHKAKGNSAKPKKAGGNTSAGVSQPSGNTDSQRSKRPIIVNNDDREFSLDFDGMMDENLLPFNDARTLKENYLALMTKLEYDIKAGAVLPFDEMISEVRKEYSRMRTRLIAIAPEHGPRLRVLASTSSDAEFVLEIQEVVHEAMEELSLDTTDSRKGEQK
ncbi:hypothetical protein D3C81_568010 [compost metagenome]